MKYNFDEAIDRRNTYSIKWDDAMRVNTQTEMIPLTIADSDFKVAPVIQAALIEAVEHGVFGYTRWDHADFKSPIINWYAQHFATDVAAEDIVYGPTVMYMMKTVLQMVAEKKEKDQLGVIIQDPAYDGFTNLLHDLSYPIAGWDFLADSAGFDMLEALCAQPGNDVLILCHPHNPTGKSFQAAALQQILEICRRHDIFVISDEIHMDFVYAPRVHTPTIKIAQQLGMAEALALITSGSKTFNLAALHTAYMILPDADLRSTYLSRLRRVDNLFGASVMGMHALMTGYRDADDWVQEMKCYIHETFGWIERFLSREQLPIGFVKPDATYFAWLDMSRFGLSEAALHEALLAEGVLVANGGAYLLQDGAYIRMSISVPRASIKKAFYAIRKIYHNISKQA